MILLSSYDLSIFDLHYNCLCDDILIYDYEILSVMILSYMAMICLCDDLYVTIIE